MVNTFLQTEMNAQEKTAYWEPCRISGGLRKRSLKYKRKLEKINCAVCSKLIARQNMFRHRKTGCNKSGKKKRGHKKHKANKQYGAEQRLMLDEGYQAENLEYNVEESGSIDYNTKIKPEHIVEFDTMTVWGELIPDHCICQRCQQNRLLSHLITADGIIVDQHFVKTGRYICHSAKVVYLNFHPLEFVSRYCDPQLKWLKVTHICLI